MADREKVISAIQNCIAVPKCRDCPWEECEEQHVAVDGIPLGLMRDALKLLEEQEPIAPAIGGNQKSCWYYICPICQLAIDKGDKYCRHCGRGVKWE